MGVELLTVVRGNAGGHRARVRTALSGAAVTALAVVAMPSSTQAAEALGQGCSTSDVCFYTGPFGSGDRCQSAEDDPDWYDGPVRCSWTETKRVRSIRNEGSTPVAVHRQPDFAGPPVCVAPGTTVNVSDRFRSHRWVAGC
ncbi:peptidase inhibitor family I36 protein [Streptomyces qaidamensis]|uniref:peptidase inhibitor family I36 protein n=1 Tax=Streptomyces qaidamensis TaxID=1783515 RepID=UPI00364BA4DD